MKSKIIHCYSCNNIAKVHSKSIFTVSETAALIGSTKKQVKRLIRHGHLSATSLFNHFYINIEELERFINNNNSN